MHCCYCSGLRDLHGPQCKLKHISLQGNQLDSIDHLLQCLLGLQGLKGVTLSEYDSDNPVCRLPGIEQNNCFSGHIKSINRIRNVQTSE